MANVVSLEGKRKGPGLEPLLALCADDMARVDREIIKWRKVILDAGIKLE